MGADILNPKRSDLDGKLTFSSDVFFDIRPPESAGGVATSTAGS